MKPKAWVAGVCLMGAAVLLFWLWLMEYSGLNLK